MPRGGRKTCRMSPCKDSTKMRRPCSKQVDELAIIILCCVSLLDEVQAVLHEAQRQGTLPLARLA